RTAPAPPGRPEQVPEPEGGEVDVPTAVVAAAASAPTAAALVAAATRGERRDEQHDEDDEVDHQHEQGPDLERRLERFPGLAARPAPQRLGVAPHQVRLEAVDQRAALPDLEVP